MAKRKTVATKKSPGKNTEQKIIDAARKLFMVKGFHAIKTRDIANEAGINIALLNYYFRSKEKLFELIMKDNILQFMQVISAIVNDESTGIEEKVQLLVENYVDMLLVNPDMPLFILSHVKEDDQRMRMREKMMGSYFMKQVTQARKTGKIGPIEPIHLMMNLVSLTIFPFIARHMLQNNKGITPEQFRQLMQERKKMIPKWISAMLKVK